MPRRLDSALARLDGLSPRRQRMVALACLAMAALLAVLLAAYWTRDRIFVLDEWKYLVPRQDWSAETLLMPDNGHLILFPLSAFKALVELFGAGSHAPFTALTISLQALVPFLLYLLAARRVGPWAALIPAVLMLFLGAGWEVLLNTAGLPNLMCIAAGFGMLLCLSRGDDRGDFAAAALLVVSLVSHTEGVAFAAGATVQLALRPERRRLWVSLGPLALWAVWAIWAQKYDQTSLVAYSVTSVANAMFDQLTAVCASLTGLFRPGGVPDVTGAISLVHLGRAVPLTFALLGLIAWRLLAGPRPSPHIWGALTILGVYLLLVAIGINELRSIESSRYAYAGSALVLLVLVELTDGLRLRRGVVLAVAAVAAIALATNIAQMRTAGSFFRSESAYNRADLAALELAREVVDPAFVPDEGITTFLPHRDLNFEAGEYFSAVDEFGSPAYSEAELLAAAEPARETADRLSARALGIEVAESLPGTPIADPDPAVLAFDGEISNRRGCVVFSPDALGSPRLEIRVPPGGAADIRAGLGEEIEITLRRFADAFTVQLTPLRGSGTVRFPVDLSAAPWHVSIATTRPLRVCRT